MQKNLFLLLIMACMFGDIIGHDGDENIQKPPHLDSFPAYLQKKRILINENREQEEDSYLSAYIEQVKGKQGAIEEEKQKWFKRFDSKRHSQQVKLYPNPKLARFFEWLESWRTWNSEPSILEAEYRKWDDWFSNACAERNSSANDYEKCVLKTAAIKKSACEKLKKERMKKIGLLRKTDEKDLKHCEIVIEAILFPKMLDIFHNHGIPVTQNEGLGIFQADPKFQ